MPPAPSRGPGVQFEKAIKLVRQCLKCLSDCWEAKVVNHCSWITACYDCKPTHIYPTIFSTFSFFLLHIICYLYATHNKHIHESSTILHQPHFHINIYYSRVFASLDSRPSYDIQVFQLMFDSIDSICCNLKYYTADLILTNL